MIKINTDFSKKSQEESSQMLRNNHLRPLCICVKVVCGQRGVYDLPFLPRRDGFPPFLCWVKYPSPTTRAGSPMGAEEDVEESPEFN